MGIGTVEQRRRLKGWSWRLPEATFTGFRREESRASLEKGDESGDAGVIARRSGAETDVDLPPQSNVDPFDTAAPCRQAPTISRIAATMAEGSILTV